MKIEYDTIGRQIVIRFPIQHLSPRDKTDLFRQLMDDLGIYDRFVEEPDAGERALTIITEQWQKAWNGEEL